MIHINTQGGRKGGAFFELRQDDHGPIRADLEDLQALVIAAQRMLGREVAE